MMFKEVQEEFAIRYYHWASREARLEVERGFPLLKRIDDVTCRKHLRRMAQLSTQDQQAFTALLVKLRHPLAVELLGETPVSSEEIAKVNMYFRGFVLELDPVDQAFLQRQLHGDPTTKLDRKRFRKTIKELLTPIFGKADPGGGGGTWSYTSSIEGRRVVTYINTGGSHHLDYDHSIQYLGQQYLHEGISVLQWLGLTSGGTYWYNLEDSRAEDTAQLLAEQCEHFMKAAPKLLEGLGP